MILIRHYVFYHISASSLPWKCGYPRRAELRGAPRSSAGLIRGKKKKKGEKKRKKCCIDH